jgi:hypothetical protein
MASGLTPIYSLPYPLSTDGVDVHGDMEDLAQKVEEILSVKSNTNTANTFTGINSFLVDSSFPAVKITQNGSGPGILIEDSASVDSTPFIVNSAGNVGIKTATPTASLTVASGDVLFSTNTKILGTTFIGEVGNSNNLVVTGNVQVSDLLETDALYILSTFDFFDTASGFNISIVPPAATTADRVLTLPNVNGTVITSGNPNDLYPSQATNTGKVLTTNGTNVSWVTSPNQVPAIAGQANKWLTTDGSTYYWENLLLIPALDDTVGTGTTGKWMTNDGEEVYWDFLPGQEAFIEVTDDIVLEVGANLFCDTRGGFFTITLPENPIPGTTVSVFDTQDFFQSEYVIINPGTEKINTIEGNLIIDVGGATVVLIYINETIGWRLA